MAFGAIHSVGKRSKVVSAQGQSAAAPQPAIARLPFELVSSIILHILGDLSKRRKRPHTINFLLINKQWAQIGRSLLWADVVLYMRNFPTFLQAAGKSPNLHSNIRSLTLKLTLSYHPFPYTSSTHPSTNPGPNITLGLQHTRNFLAQLTQLLPTFTNLTTFSLSLRSPRPDDRLTSISCPQLADLIDSLPAGVSNLELDTGGKDDDDGSGNSSNSSAGYRHLCDSIHARLPALVHLRFAANHVCSVLACGGDDGLHGHSYVEGGDDGGNGHDYAPDDLAYPHLRTLVLRLYTRPWIARVTVQVAVAWAARAPGAEFISVVAPEMGDNRYLKELRGWEFWRRVDKPGNSFWRDDQVFIQLASLGYDSFSGSVVQAPVCLLFCYGSIYNGEVGVYFPKKRGWGEEKRRELQVEGLDRGWVSLVRGQRVPKALVAEDVNVVIEKNGWKEKQWWEGYK